MAAALGESEANNEGTNNGFGKPEANDTSAQMNCPDMAGLSTTWAPRWWRVRAPPAFPPHPLAVLAAIVNGIARCTAR